MFLQFSFGDRARTMTGCCLKKENSAVLKQSRHTPWIKMR
jgi:hypothetical protein